MEIFPGEPADPVKVICVLVFTKYKNRIIFSKFSMSFPGLVVDKSVGRQYQIVSWLINIHSILGAKNTNIMFFGEIF